MPFLVADSDGRPLLEAQVDPADLAALRARYRENSVSLALAVLAVAMLVVAVPVEEWRRGRRTPGGARHGLGCARRADADRAHPAVGGHACSAGCGPRHKRRVRAHPALFFRSPVDLLATAVLLLALVALAADVLERRRLRVRPHHAPAARVASIAAFAGSQLARAWRWQPCSLPITP